MICLKGIFQISRWSASFNTEEKSLVNCLFSFSSLNSLKNTCTHTHIHIHAHTHIHSYMYAHTRTHTHTHTHMHTHTRTHKCSGILLTSNNCVRVQCKLYCGLCSGVSCSGLYHDTLSLSLALSLSPSHTDALECAAKFLKWKMTQ